MERETQIVGYLRAITAILGVLAIAVVVIGTVALRKIERAVKVSEHLSARVDQAMDAAAPVGKAVVEKGVDAIHQMDAKDLGEQAGKGVKELGAAAKEKALQLIKKQDGSK